MPDGALFRSMSKREAKEFFDRFLAEAVPSVKDLRQAVQEAGPEWRDLSLDFSSASLVKLWTYFRAHLTTRPRSDSELQAVPEWARPWASSEEFSDETKVMIFRIAFYLAEVLLRERHSLKWGIGRFTYRNQPVLTGFKGNGEASPLVLVENLAWRAIRGKSVDGDLERIFSVWVAEVEADPAQLER